MRARIAVRSDDQEYFSLSLSVFSSEGAFEKTPTVVQRALVRHVPKAIRFGRAHHHFLRMRSHPYPRGVLERLEF
jgi:hypothetical protein